jgi:hypothetical protein
MLNQNLHHDASKLAFTPMPASKPFPRSGSPESESRTLLAAAAEFFSALGTENSRGFLDGKKQTGGE